MQRTYGLSFSLIIVFAATAFAADNQRLIEVVLADHAAASDKADYIHERTINESQAKAANKLVKLAEHAFRDGDRTAETNAWRALLAFDPSHEKARKYFSDLGTLDKEMAALPAGGKGKDSSALKMVGKWRIRYNHEKTADATITPNGTLVYSWMGDKPTEHRIQPSSRSIVVPLGEGSGRNDVHRVTPAGDKLLIEAWWPASAYDPNTPPSHFGYATRLVEGTGK